MKQLIIFIATLLMSIECLAKSEDFSDGAPAQEYDFEFALSDIKAGEERYAIITKGKNSVSNLTIPNQVEAYVWTNGQYEPHIFCVKEIGDGAFWSLSNNESILESVVLGDQIEKIDEYAFKNCKLLKSIVMPGVKSIGKEAFGDCCNLSEVNMPAVETIGDGAFMKCESLENITLPQSLNHIGSSAFSGCIKITSIELPETLTEIEASSFSNCNLREIHIPNSVKTIGTNAFGKNAELKEVVIPATVTSIQQNPFTGCSALTSIIVESGNSTYDSRDNCNAIIETATNTLIAACNTSVIPNGIESIGAFAFYYTSITSLDLPETVKSIGYCAFSYCSNLESIHICKNVASIGSSAFYWCGKLSSIIVDSDNEVYDSRNNCNAIIETKSDKLIVGGSNTIIPEGIKAIEMDAFINCEGLTSITIPASVTEIGSNAFASCKNLTDVTNNATIPQSISDNVFDIEYLPGYTYLMINKTLHVPAGTRDTYKQSAIWTKFVKIIEEGNGSANIENITSAYEDNTTSYNLQGMKVDNNYKGIVIINGKKILKK